MSNRRRRQRAGIPRGGTNDVAQIIEIFQDKQPEVAPRFITDPEISGTVPQPFDEIGAPPAALPVVLFEPTEAIAVRFSNGDVAESQVDAIVQQGFSRWRPIVAFNTLDGWSVRQTGDGLELWDAGGLWAVGTVQIDVKWLRAAEELGYVLAVY